VCQSQDPEVKLIRIRDSLPGLTEDQTVCDADNLNQKYKSDDQPIAQSGDPIYKKGNLIKEEHFRKGFLIYQSLRVEELLDTTGEIGSANGWETSADEKTTVQNLNRWRHFPMIIGWAGGSNHFMALIGLYREGKGDNAKLMAVLTDSYYGTSVMKFTTFKTSNTYQGNGRMIELFYTKPKS
jgi:hypothetical protein